MQTTFSVLFYPRGNDVDKGGNVTIYLRITVDGKRSELSIKRKVLLTRWIPEAGKVRGTSSDVKDLNRYLDSIKNKIYKIYENLIENGELITANLIKDIYLGKTIQPKMLLEIFQIHNDRIERLVGREFAPGTIERYKTAKKHVEDYIKLEYGLSDIPVKDVDYKFISGLEYYLKSVRKCGHNTTVKYITNFKKIIRIAFANDWIQKDPFLHWKGRLKIVEREYLTKLEILLLLDKEFNNFRLDLVKDIFLFSCFTGLAYADVKKLSQDHIVIGIDGGKWIWIFHPKVYHCSDPKFTTDSEAMFTTGSGV